MYKVSSGAISKVLTLQLLAVPYQTFYWIAEYLVRLSTEVLLDNKIKTQSLNRHVLLSRFLDAMSTAQRNFM